MKRTLELISCKPFWIMGEEGDMERDDLSGEAIADTLWKCLYTDQLVELMQALESLEEAEVVRIVGDAEVIRRKASESV